MKTLIIVAISFLVSCIAQAPPCYLPPQFMSNIQQTRKTNGCTTFSLSGQLYFDYPNQRLRIDSSDVIYDDTFTESVWLDYTNQIGYFYNRDDNECESTSITGMLNSPQIPSNATYLAEYLIGSQPLDVWYSDNDEDDELAVVFSITRGSCFPYIVDIVNSTTGYTTLIEFLTNVLPDLPPFYFDIPAICTDSKLNPHFNIMDKLRIKNPFQ